MGSFRRVNEHTLLKRGLRPGIQVIDLGANHGQFSEQLAAEYPGTYHAIEANPVLAERLEDSVFATVRCCAVIGESGRTVTLNLAEGDEASSVLTLPAVSIYKATKVGQVTVDGVALLEVLRDHPGQIDVLKVDIEGAEVLTLPYLAQTDLNRIGQITVEFHSARAFGFSLRRQARHTIRRLRQQGFLALDFDRDHRDTVFVNRKLLNVGWSDGVRWRVEAALVRWRPVARTAWHAVGLPARRS